VKLLKAFSDLSIGRVVIMAIFIAAGYYFTYFDQGTTIEEQINTVQGLVNQEEARKTEINKTMKKEEEMRGNVLQLQRNVEVVKSKIPIDLKDSQMQSLINAAAEASQVKITGLSVLGGQRKDPNAPPVKISINDVKPENLIEEIKFKVAIIGTFDNFLTFVETLGKDDKVIKIKNFSIQKNSEDIDDDKIIFNGEVVGFKQANIEIVSGVK
jgi:Tfp pilus assembly protein PilO